MMVVSMVDSSAATKVARTVVWRVDLLVDEWVEMMVVSMVA